MVGNLFSNNVNSIGIGYFYKGFNIIQYSRDFKLDDKATALISIGYPSYGIGCYYSNNYKQNGWDVGVSVSREYFTENSLEFDFKRNSFYMLLFTSYKWELWDSSIFFTTGLNYGMVYDNDKYDGSNFFLLPILWIEKRF